MNDIYQKSIFGITMAKVRQNGLSGIIICAMKFLSPPPPFISAVHQIAQNVPTIFYTEAAGKYAGNRYQATLLLSVIRNQKKN